LSGIAEFLSGLIASATEAAAYPYPKPKRPEPPTAVAVGTAAADSAPAAAVGIEAADSAPTAAVGTAATDSSPAAAVGTAATDSSPAAAVGIATADGSPAASFVAEAAVDTAASSEKAPAPAEVANEPRPDGAPSCDKKRSWWRWTTRTLRTRIEEVFGIDVCKETVRRVLHRIGLSWKKAKKLLAKANPEQRIAFVADIRALLDRVLHEEILVLAYIDEGHVHQDADMGYGWSPRGQRLHVASSSPGLHAKVSFYGIYLYSESQVHIWPYPRANGEHTIDVLERLRVEFQQRPMIVIWDGASYHRSACVLAAAARLGIQLVRLPAYSPDFMPVEALWHWLRENVTYNYCHQTARELIERVASFVTEINRDACALADRLWVKDELDPEEEKLRFSA
jgi:transposase